MTDCEVPPAAYYVELQKDMIRRHPKACPHVLGHLLALEAFFDNSIVAGFSYGVAKAQILKIMRDSRNGSYATMGAGFWVVAKLAALAKLGSSRSVWALGASVGRFSS